MHMDLDEGQKRGIDYLQHKLNPKRIQAMSAEFRVVANLQAVVVGGWAENKDGEIADFEVAVGRMRGDILSWKVLPRKG